LPENSIRIDRVSRRPSSRQRWRCHTIEGVGQYRDQVGAGWAFRCRRANRGKGAGLAALRVRNHCIERWLRIASLAWPDPVTPVNVFNRSLIRDALSKGQRSLGTVRWRFGTKETQQCPCRQQSQVKRASNKMRFNRGANVRFHPACGCA
jgi:hypothetical protein